MQAVLLLSWTFFLRENFILVNVVVVDSCFQIFVICSVFVSCVCSVFVYVNITQYFNAISIKPATLILQNYSHAARFSKYP